MHEDTPNQPSSAPLILLDIDDVLFDTAYFKSSGLTVFRLYEEVLEVLDEIADFSEVGILSQGEHAFQMKKIVETGIHERFHKDHIHIVEKKDESLKSILKKYNTFNGQIYFIDDRLNSLYYAKKAVKRMTCIWLHRGRYAGQQEKFASFEPDFEIKSLKEILTIVKKET